MLRVRFTHEHAVPGSQLNSHYPTTPEQSHVEREKQENAVFPVVHSDISQAF